MRRPTRRTAQAVTACVLLKARSSSTLYGRRAGPGCTRTFAAGLRRLIRDDADGVPRLIDVNAHPEWRAEGMMARMAGYAGIDYPDLLARIIDGARARITAAEKGADTHG